MSARTVYGYELRVLACPGCGAPLDVATSGGAVVCSYCGTRSTLQPRDERQDRERAAENRAAPLGESERLARLREQAATEEMLPASLSAMLDHDGRLPPERAEEVVRLWRDTRASLATRGDFITSERLFHLTRLLLPHVDHQARRAFLETAIELLPDYRHRHVLRCELAMGAARLSELEAALEWLDAVERRPADLLMDSAVRMASATVEHARGRWQQVLAELGEHEGDVPFAPSYRDVTALFRIDALERLGQAAAAAAALEALIDRIGRSGFDRLAHEQEPLIVGRQTQRTREREEMMRVAGIVRGRLEEANRPWFAWPKVAAFVVVTVVTSLVLGIVWAALAEAYEVDPFGGVHAQLYCPMVCPGCRGPYRIISWYNWELSENTRLSAWYCQDPAGAISRLSEDELKRASFFVEPWTLEYRVSSGSLFGTTILGVTPVGMLVAALLLLAGYRFRVRRRAALAAEHAALQARLALGEGEPDLRQRT